jgi:hypothetical protein
MSPAAGIDSGTETAITTEYLVMRIDRLIELIQDCLCVIGDGSNVLAKRDNMLDAISSSGDMHPSVLDICGVSILDVCGVSTSGGNILVTFGTTSPGTDDGLWGVDGILGAPDGNLWGVGGILDTMGNDLTTTNSDTMGKFGLSVASILSVFSKVIV